MANERGDGMSDVLTLAEVLLLIEALKDRFDRAVEFNLPFEEARAMVHVYDKLKRYEEELRECLDS
jgi:AAA+ superfamily predicted ATPase